MLLKTMIALMVAAFSVEVYAADNKGPKIVVEPDQTDIYAIPLDEDDQSQEEEVTEFENYKK